MKIKITRNGKVKTESFDGEILLEAAIKQSGMQLHMPCGGNGTCGKCKVVVRGEKGTLSAKTPEELKHLTDEELAQGVRLACMTRAFGDCEVEIHSNKSIVLTSGTLPEFDVSPVGEKYGFAVDIGTTTVAVYLLDLKQCKQVSSATFHNPQTVFGADVVSRIEAALSGNAGKLQALIASKLNKTFLSLCEQNSLSAQDIDSIAITGNTTMMYLLAQESTEPLSHSPFAITEFYGRDLDASMLKLDDFAGVPVYIPRVISAFVGSDITCSILASDMMKKSEFTILVDIGTNGEMAAYDAENLYCCSTAAGPAFEGAGITFGAPAANGAIDRVELRDGKVEYRVIGDVDAVGICGSGLIDAVAALIDMGVLEESGSIDEEYAPKEYIEYICEYNGELAVQIADSGVYITQKDIRSIQLAKSAICAGIYSLINATGKNTQDVSKLLLAGGFGSFLNPINAGRIGLIPSELSQISVPIGNAAGMGAVMTVLSRNSRDQSKLFSQNAQTIELSTSKFFMSKYIECMMF